MAQYNAEAHKPFLKGQKNDSNNAQAICLAVQQPHILAQLLPKRPRLWLI